ncbi:hypothetical protein ACH5RR_037679 [Cinchona calisaya]|uniref:F-box/LRR-repeat protein n=1 Tax=Cinchona calisaya TaxID=153742 RepID=A0ABD2YBM2_9GENT
MDQYDAESWVNTAILRVVRKLELELKFPTAVGLFCRQVSLPAKHLFLVLENLIIVTRSSNNLINVSISALALKRLRIVSWCNEHLDIVESLRLLEITNFDNLVEAIVDLGMPLEYQFKFCEAISNVKCLSISSYTSDTISWETVFYSTKFLNLTHLALRAWYPLLRYFLENADKLEVLTFSEMGLGKQALDNLVLTEHVPSCLSSCLRAISIDNFCS